LTSNEEQNIVPVAHKKEKRIKSGQPKKHAALKKKAI
jgi:hypothetical protein